MNYKIYMRGGEEAAKVIKALKIESLAVNTTIPNYGSNEKEVYGIPKDYQGGTLFIVWCSIYNNRFKEDGYIEVTPAQFYKTISGREWVSGVFPKLQKEKIYCFGSPLFKVVLTKLVRDNICKANSLSLSIAKECNTVWGYSQCMNYGKDVGYSTELNYFYNAGYRLVTPEEFYKIWSGKDWDCIEPVKSEKKYIGFKGSTDVNLSLLPENIKNPNNFCGLAPIIYYVKDNVLCIVDENEEEDLLEKIDVFDWTDFLAIVTASTHEVPFISEQIKASIPPGLCIPQPSILETESSDCNKFILPKKQTLKIVL